MRFLVFVVVLIKAFGFVIVTSPMFLISTGAYFFVSFTDAIGFLGVALVWVLGFFIVKFTESFGIILIAALMGFILERYGFFIGSFLVLCFVADAKLIVSYGSVGFYKCGMYYTGPGYATQCWRQER